MSATLPRTTLPHTMLLPSPLAAARPASTFWERGGGGWQVVAGGELEPRFHSDIREISRRVPLPPAVAR